MRTLAALGLALAAFPVCSAAVHAQACDVAASLDWCARDHGFNEGATCGLDALSRAGLQGLPAAAPQDALGKTWDRASMLIYARAAAKAGWVPVAVNAAICCQTHDPTARACLRRNRGDVAAWLLR